jgi:conjugal transfer pilus assembly protein TraB
MSLKDRWNGLSPNAKRASVLGGAALAILALAAGSAIFSPPPGSAKKTPQETMVRNILTDTDPRSLGVEAMAARLERMERKVSDLGAKAAEKAQAPAVAPDPEEALARKVEMEALRVEIDGLRAALDEAKKAQDSRPSIPQPIAEPPTGLTPAKPPAPAVPRPPAPGAPLEQMFGPPGTGGQGLSPAPGEAAAPAKGGGRTLTIRTVGQEAQSQAQGQAKGGDKSAHKEGVYIPAGAILSGVFLNGLDMPTGQQARSQPTPALIRVKDLAILPNRVRADVRECFIIVGGYGDLASERAYLRGETFTCVRSDGGVIEVPIDGYAVGEDGKVGLRGRVVSKQGAMLAKALQAGFLQAFAAMFNQVPAIPIYNAGTGNQQQYQSQFSAESAGAAAAKGVGSALDRLANYYMDMAEQTFPVLEVDAGRGVDLILNAGVSLRLADTGGSGRAGAASRREGASAPGPRVMEEGRAMLNRWSDTAEAAGKELQRQSQWQSARP